MMNTASLKQEYKERIAPALMKQFGYTSTMQIPVLEKIVLNQGLGSAVADKKIIEVAVNEMTAISGQKAVPTYSKKDISNFKLRKKMPMCYVAWRPYVRIFGKSHQSGSSPYQGLQRYKQQIGREGELYPGCPGANNFS